MTNPPLDSARQARTRALIIPREHGAWGLLLVPLITGAAAGLRVEHRPAPVLLFALAMLALFWLRTPVESLLGTTPLSAHMPAERRIAWLASAILSTVAAACLAVLLLNHQNQALWLFGAIAVLLFAVQTILRTRKLRMTAQLVGALALTSAAPAAYYIASGHLDRHAWGLWAANWLFAGNQIHFVHLRIHAARAANFADKFAASPWFFANQFLVIPVLFLAARQNWIPYATILAFIPVLLRGLIWFFRKPAPLQIKALGWSEMKQGVLFAVLLSFAFSV
jgi:hypothetical protein